VQVGKQPLETRRARKIVRVLRRKLVGEPVGQFALHDKCGSTGSQQSLQLEQLSEAFRFSPAPLSPAFSYQFADVSQRSHYCASSDSNERTRVGGDQHARERHCQRVGAVKPSVRATEQRMHSIPEVLMVLDQHAVFKNA
jgi:hypothetical protein